MTKYECMEWLFSHFDETENNLLSLPCMIEEWKDILGYEGLYQISNLGNVRSLKWGKKRILKTIKNNKGYLQIGLSKEGRKVHQLIHRLVAAAFIPNPDNLPQVNHKDECKSNNRVDNLEYCDCTHNINYGTRNERVGKTKNKPIFCIELNKAFESTVEAARWVGKSNAHININYCLKGKYKTAYGYHWKYI